MDDTRPDTRPQLHEALQRFPDSAEAVDLIAAVLKIALEGEPADDAAEDTRHDRIRAELTAVSSDVRTRTGVVLSALHRVTEEMRGLVLVIKDEQADPDVVAGDVVVLPDGWLVVMMGGVEIARFPFDPQRDPAEAERMATETLGEYVTLHVQGRAAAAGIVGDALRSDTGALATRRLPTGELVAAVRIAATRRREPVDEAHE